MFFKLDTSVTRNFATPLGNTLLVFPTATTAVLRKLAARRGVWGALRAVAAALSGRSGLAPESVEGNVQRKQIRLPSVFGNPFISSLYRRIKMGEAALLYQALTDELTAAPPEVTIIYNGSVSPEAVLDQIAVAQDLPRVYVEAGFFPRTLQIDPLGLNGANTVPRDPSFYSSAQQDFAAGGLPDALNTRATKPKPGQAIELQPGYVFVAFQVPSDMQITRHSPWIPDMEAFLDAILQAAERIPDDVFVIKEHPSFKRSVQGLRPAHPRVIFANHNVTSELIDESRAVITINSTVGIEALLLDKPVITLGRACYNIEGLVLHADGPDALTDAIDRSRAWHPDPHLRRQFLGYLWNHYLLHGSYEAPPNELAAELRRRAQPDFPVAVNARH